MTGVATASGARRCAAALAFAVALVAIGIGAAFSASACAVLLVFEAFCLVPLGAVVIFEVRPAVTELWCATTTARRAVQRFRRQLEALPETPHPLGA